MLTVTLDKTADAVLIMRAIASMNGVKEVTTEKPPGDFVLPFSSPEFENAWLDYTIMRRSMGKAKRLTRRGAELALKKLSAMGERDAVQALQNSVANGWQGIFPPSKKVTQRRVPAPMGPSEKIAVRDL